MSITKHPWIFAFFPAGKVPPFKSTTLVVSGSFVIFENCQVMSSCNSLRAWERKKGGVQASRKYYSVSWCCKHKRWISFAYDSINLLIGIWYKKWAVFFPQCPVFVYWVDVENSNHGNAYRMTGSWTWPAKGPDRFTPDVAVESPGDLGPFASMKLQKLCDLQIYLFRLSCKSPSVTIS